MSATTAVPVAAAEADDDVAVKKNPAMQALDAIKAAAVARKRKKTAVAGPSADAADAVAALRWDSDDDAW